MLPVGAVRQHADMPPEVTPPGWPTRVRPSYAPGFERSAVNWLFDQCPPEYRAYPVLQRHPQVLARFAVIHLVAMTEAARRGLSGARTELGDVATPEVVAQVVEAWNAEGARLSARAREARLVEEALRGRRYTARLT